MTQENSADLNKNSKHGIDNFDLSISKITLRFIEPNEEIKFAEKFKINIRLNIVLIISTLVFIGYFYIYRIERLAYAIRAPDDVNTTLNEEIILFTVATLVLLCELFLKITGYLQFYQGFILYVTLPIMAVYAAFSANNAPVFGVAYFVKLLF